MAVAVAVAVAVPGAGLTKKIFNHIQKDFLINVLGNFANEAKPTTVSQRTKECQRFDKNLFRFFFPVVCIIVSNFCFQISNFNWMDGSVQPQPGQLKFEI